MSSDMITGVLMGIFFALLFVNFVLVILLVIKKKAKPIPKKESKPEEKKDSLFGFRNLFSQKIEGGKKQ